MMHAVLAILNDYLAWEKFKTSTNYNNLPYSDQHDIRLQYDNDAKYYYEVMGLSKAQALCADTIVSFWTPYKRLLQLKANWYSTKSAPSLTALLNKLTAEGGRSEAVKSASEYALPLAEVCYTKSNYMLLPNSRMNIDRYKVSQDRIDLTLYECFENGALSHHFENDDALVDWIKENKLSLLFDGDIKKENIIWMVDGNKPKLITDMNEQEIEQYFDSAVDFITKRNLLLR